MGYACPVCGAEQADAVHLAHHLAVTASLGRTEHREWLAEYAPEWADSGPEELADRVAPHAPAVETPDFDDHGHDHDGARPSFEDELARQTGGAGRGGPVGSPRGGDRAEGVLAEARELTRRMYESGDDASPDEGERDADERGDDDRGDDGRESDDQSDAEGGGRDAAPDRTDDGDENE